MRLIRIAAALAIILLPSSGTRAQDAAQSPALSYGAVDRATVRVFAVHGVAAARVESDSGVDRLIAVPESGHGSGILVSSDGLVLTAHHVVEDARLLAVWVPGESRAYPATVVYEDEEHDFAFVAVAGEFPQHIALELPREQLRVRQTVHAIGYPLDARRTDPQSSRGIISGVLPSGELQLDMALNPGNSGGPLIDEQENVVGIVVARGDPTRGVQNIGVAVPVSIMRDAMHTQVRTDDRVTRARERLATGPGADIAELVTILARVGAAELIREVMDVVDHHRQGEILPRLRSLGDRSEDAEVIALTAAYLWDTAAVILERNGGAMRASQLPDGPDRRVAADLLLRAVALCRRAAQRDPTLAARSPFVAHVLHYLAAVPVEAAPPVVAAQQPAQPAPPAPSPPAAAAPSAPAAASWAVQQTDAERPRPERPRGPRQPDYRTHLGVALSLPHQAAPGFGIGGAAGSFIVDVSPYTLRAGPVAGDLWIGGRLHIGGWGGNTLVVAGPELGIGIRIGDRNAASFGVTYAPALALGANATSVVPAGVRAYAGAFFDPFTIAIGWEALGLPNTYSLHLYQLLFQVGL